MYPHHPFWKMTWYFWVLLGVVIIYACIFQLLMAHVEGKHYGWVTAFYWTLTVMSTLGFGDVVFESNIGKSFTILVLTTGVIQVMILLPIVFIRFSPWIEQLTRVRVPARVPDSVRDHVIITFFDPLITPGLLTHFGDLGIPVYVIQPDAEKAAQQYVQGIPVIIGEPDTFDTFARLRVEEARMVFVNDLDTINTNIVLTIREFEPHVQIVALADKEHSIDVLELSGADRVLPLKRWLGEQLANRVNTFHERLSSIGTFDQLGISEMVVHGSFMEGKPVSETGLRERSGVSIVGVWQGSKLISVTPDLVLESGQVVVLVGTQEQLNSLEGELTNTETETSPVLIIGGGHVGISAAKRLREKGIKVHFVEKEAALEDHLSNISDEVYIGDAAEYSILVRAGIMQASAVVVTTNDDAVNIYLTSYCRHLNERVRIVSRITHERNVEASHRAGSDLVLRYSSIGVEAVLAALENRTMMVLGEYLQFYHVSTPSSLFGKTLGESRIGAETGLIVLAIEHEGQVKAHLSKHCTFLSGSRLHVLGNSDQLNHFRRKFL